MKVEDRLTHLLFEARQSGGDAAFDDMSVLRSQLSRKAPDLHGEIQALTAALAHGWPGRIAAVPQPDQARSDAAAQIAQQEKLPIAVVGPALAVACQAAPQLGISMAPPATDAWAGDSMVVGAPDPANQQPPYQPHQFQPPQAAPHYPQGFPDPKGGQPPYPGPNYGAGGGYPPQGPQRQPDPWNSYDMSGQPQPFYTKVWFFLLIGLLIVGGAVLATQWNNLFGRGTTVGTPPVRTGGNGSAAPAPRADDQLFTPGGPVLSRTDDGPFIAPQRAADGRHGLSFSVPYEGGRADGALILPTSWNGQGMLVGTKPDGSRSIGTGSWELDSDDGTSNPRPVRRMRVQWRQDGIEAGPTGIAVIGLPGQSDVVLPGAAFCVMDGTSGEPLACGQVR